MWGRSWIFVLASTRAILELTMALMVAIELIAAEFMAVEILAIEIKYDRQGQQEDDDRERRLTY